MYKFCNNIFEINQELDVFWNKFYTEFCAHIHIKHHLLVNTSTRQFIEYLSKYFKNDITHTEGRIWWNVSNESYLFRRSMTQYLLQCYVQIRFVTESTLRDRWVGDNARCQVCRFRKCLQWRRYRSPRRRLHRRRLTMPHSAATRARMWHSFASLTSAHCIWKLLFLASSRAYAA